MIIGLGLLIPQLSIAKTLATKLRQKLRSTRKKQRNRFPNDLVFAGNYSYNEGFIKDFIWWSAEFIDQDGFGDEYAKRRLQSLAKHIDSLYENLKREVA